MTTTTATVDHRHRCEVRHWLHMRNKRSAEWLRTELSEIERRRGKPAADRLRQDILEQWERGNRGAVNDWREAA